MRPRISPSSRQHRRRHRNRRAARILLGVNAFISLPCQSVTVSPWIGGRGDRAQSTLAPFAVARRDPFAPVTASTTDARLDPARVPAVDLNAIAATGRQPTSVISGTVPQTAQFELRLSFLDAMTKLAKRQVRIVRG